MKKFLQCFMMMALLAGCEEATESHKVVGPDKPSGPGTEQQLTCDQMNCPGGCCDGKCVDLASDSQNCGKCGVKCEPGAYCVEKACARECIGENVQICNGQCVNISTNVMHCGGCNMGCGDNMDCTGKSCTCRSGWYNCDGNAVNGCESNSECICVAHEKQLCFPFDSGKPGVGRCKNGTSECDENGIWGDCEGAVGPAPEDLTNGIDDDCNGKIDDGGDVDMDGDGFTVAQGDCCDSINNCHVKIDCPSDRICKVKDPALVNPAAWDDPDNNIDDNCDGIIDNGEPGGGFQEKPGSCSDGAYDFSADTKLGSEDALKLARAMDICDMADETGGGLISAELLLADGSPLPEKCDKSICGNQKSCVSPAEQIAVADSLGGIVKPIANKTMAVLSSGRAEGSRNKSMRDCVGTEVSAPKVFLDAHGGKLPASSICESERKDTRANDSIMLRLKMRAPAGAKGFSFKFKFFSKEYPEFVCGNYNDFFLALVDGKDSRIPADHNVAFDENKDPVSVNNAFFTECNKNACRDKKGCSSCKNGSENLKAYVTDINKAGATGWLMTSVPVSAKEEFTLDLIIFDAGEPKDGGTSNNGYGHLYDSLVLIDGFSWTGKSTTLETVEVIN